MCLSVCGAPHCKYYWPPQIFRPFAIPDVRAVIEGHLIEQVLLLNVVKFGGGGGAIVPLAPSVPPSLMTQRKLS